MAWFSPTPLEISAIEQIETAFDDPTLHEIEREDLLRRLWVRLERAHGGKVLSLVSPEGIVIERPFETEP
jgi:hypothetical protein